MTIADSRLMRSVYEGRPTGKLTAAKLPHGQSAPCSEV